MAILPDSIVGLTFGNFTTLYFGKTDPVEFDFDCVCAGWDDYCFGCYLGAEDGWLDDAESVNL